MSETPFLIVGLGNPGKPYEDTRHNIGFRCIQGLAERYGITGKQETKMKALVGKGTIRDQRVYLVQPTTFMNLSGEAVARVAQYYKIPLENSLILYDDVDLPLGRIRFRPEGSAGTHNGMKSVIARMGSAQIPRLRIGIGQVGIDLADYVLSQFTPEEEPLVREVVDMAVQSCIDWLLHGMTFAMNQYNARALPFREEDECMTQMPIDNDG